MATHKVYLLKSKISGGRESLFLKFYPPIRDPQTMKMVYKEMLGMFVYSTPKNSMETTHNKEILGIAEGVRAIRIQSLLREEYGFLDKHKLRGDFLEWFREVAVTKYDKWVCVYKHFERFVKGSCTFEDVTVHLCRNFREYLLTAKQIDDPTKKIKKTSASGYFSTFQAALKIAYRDKKIKENVNEHLDQIKAPRPKVNFLTIPELVRLSETPCEIPILKRASLFSCLTGLRKSDILRLDWSDIMEASEGGLNMRIKIKKTDNDVTLPVSYEALA